MQSRCASPPLPAPDAPAILEVLRGLAPRPGDVLALDADGTLWRGDVGDDLMFAAIEADLFQEEAREGLERILREHNLDSTGSLAELVARIDAGFRAGQVSELQTYEMMTWGYGGLTDDALRAFAREALLRAGLPDRVHPAIPEVLAFAHGAGLRVQIVSASPVQAVQVGVDLCGLAVHGITAGRQARQGDRLLAHLAEPLPYGPQKVVAARAAVGDARWLCSFGDSAFDVELLAAAELSVIVGARPALRARLAELPGTVLIYEP